MRNTRRPRFDCRLRKLKQRAFKWYINSWSYSKNSLSYSTLKKNKERRIANFYFKMRLVNSFKGRFQFSQRQCLSLGETNQLSHQNFKSNEIEFSKKWTCAPPFAFLWLITILALVCSILFGIEQIFGHMTILASWIDSDYQKWIWNSN